MDAPTPTALRTLRLQIVDGIDPPCPICRSSLILIPTRACSIQRSAFQYRCKNSACSLPPGIAEDEIAVDRWNSRSFRRSMCRSALSAARTAFKAVGILAVAGIAFTVWITYLIESAPHQIAGSSDGAFVARVRLIEDGASSEVKVVVGPTDGTSELGIITATEGTEIALDWKAARTLVIDCRTAGDVIPLDALRDDDTVLIGTETIIVEFRNDRPRRH